MSELLRLTEDKTVNTDYIVHIDHSDPQWDPVKIWMEGWHNPIEVETEFVDSVLRWLQRGDLRNDTGSDPKH